MVIIFNSFLLTLLMFAACAFVAHLIGLDKENE